MTVEIDEDTREWTVQVRRELHRNPHPTGEEEGTQEMLLQYLEDMGIGGRKVAGNGIVADIEGARPGRSVALRADIDALRITEAETDLNADYISRNPGVMHACGHDGHMAMVLGAARVLVGMRDTLPGNVRIILQPHEELAPGGAMDMIAAGCLEGVDAIYGFHIMGYIPSGVVAVRAGPMMAHIRIFEAAVTGRSGHHMDPDQCIDPIVIASRFVTSVERDVSNALDPTHSFVLGFGRVHGGTLFNQTPDRVEVSGTFRTFDEDDADLIGDVMDRTLRGLVGSFRGDEGDDLPSYELQITPGYPVLMNDARLAERAVNLLRGEGMEVDAFPRLNFGAEDFAYYAREVPGLFMFLGTNNPGKGITAVNHSSRFDIDEDVLEVGVRALVALSMDLLGEDTT